MKRAKLLCIALLPLVVASVSIVVVAAFLEMHNGIFSALLGHEIAVGNSGFIVAAGVATGTIVWDIAMLTVCEDWWYRIGDRVRLHKIAVWTPVACIAIWATLLLAARVSWGSPLTWLADGSFIMLTYFGLPYVLCMIVITIAYTTKWARDEIAMRCGLPV